MLGVVLGLARRHDDRRRRRARATHRRIARALQRRRPRRPGGGGCRCSRADSISRKPPSRSTASPRARTSPSFCNLGKATCLGGIGFGTFGAVDRLRREIDVTLALAPDDAEALAAKGVLLMKLPHWLGGDHREAELWLRRALAVDPLNATARAYLDEVGATAPPFVAPAADSRVTR